MKKYIIYSLLLFLAFFSSCEDALKLLPPDGQVKDEYWKRKEDVNATLMGAYKMLAESDELLFYYGELRADMVDADGNLSNELRDIINSNIYPWNEWTNWKSFYASINLCNLVLKYSPEVKKLDGNFTDYQYNQLNAEAVFLRSLSYFYLVRVFNDVPFILAPYDTDKQDLFPAKTDSELILDSLEVQLNRILTQIPKEFETEAKTRGRATRGAVYALLADIALWNFDYQACINYVEKIESSDLYDLVPGGSWFTIFSEGNTREGIFELQFDSQLGQDNSIYDITSASSNRLLVSANAILKLSPIDAKEVIRGNGSLNLDKLLWKYIGQSADGISFRSGDDRKSCNWIVYRLADVLLMKAEALSQMGNYGDALLIVNSIRERAFMESYPSYENSARAFEDLILDERSKELAFEGKRWFDLLRMGRRNNNERKSKLIEVIIENVPATQKRILATKLNDPNGWYLPIFEGELENNINLKQNPYYQIYEANTK